MRAKQAKIALAAAVVAGAASVSGGLYAPAAHAASTPPSITSLTLTFPSGTSLDNPGGVATDNNGSVYFSNTEDNVVGKFAGSTTSTFAGGYEQSGNLNGATGDTGPATSAGLYQPAGLAYDSKGDVFIADTGDNEVEEVTPDGNFHIIAGTGQAGYSGDGGPAVSATFDQPNAVAVDAAGDVFVADTFNNVIREILPNRTVRTIAGSYVTDSTGFPTGGYSGDGGPATSAQLNAPDGVAVDSLGNLYIADTANNVIRRVGTDGIITTVAGNYALNDPNSGQGGFSGDGGAATSAQLNTPEGVALDRSGDLFIADTFNNAIREVSPTGIISTIVNVKATKGKVTNPKSGAAPTAATAGGLSDPEAVAVDNSTGNIYIADANNNLIDQVTGLPVPGAAAGGPTVGGPPAATPEVPWAPALPVAAVAIGGGFFLFRRLKARRLARVATR